MVKIDYKFADGHTEKIEVSEEVAEFIIASNREERALEERERYHTDIYLDAGEYEGLWFADNETPDYFYNLKEEQERVDAFIETLEEHEQRRLRLKMDEPSLSYCQIAAIEGVNESSIRRCFQRIFVKFKSFFSDLVPNSVPLFCK